MPTYSYRCTECGEAFDIVQSFTDNTLTICPNCGGPLRKVFSPVGVSFSGSGFYRTDSRAAETTKKDVPASDSGSSTPAASPASTASPAAKPASKSEHKKSTPKKES